MGASAGNIDQFNLMTFGDDLATMQQDVQDTIQQGLPASKFVVGSTSANTTAARWLRAIRGLRGAGRSQWGVRLGGPRRLPAGEHLRGRSRLRRTVTRRRHAVTALVLLGLLLGTDTGAAKVSRAPKNRSAPRVSGSPVVGRTLVASHGRWTRSPGRYSYRWLRCNAGGKKCRKISRAKSARYLLRRATCKPACASRSRAWNRSGSGQAMSRATSAVTQDLQPAPPPPGPPPPPAPPPGGVVMTEDLGGLPSPA